jgi:phosphatidylinositol alpha-mannosyltransferase
LRVAIASEYARPWPGGISEHVHHEALELARRGHEVAILSGPARAAGAACAGDDPAGEPRVRVLRFGHELCFTHNGARSRLLVGGFLLGLRRVLRELRADVLHVHAPMDPLFGWAALAAAPCPSVGTFHASFEPELLWDVLYRGLRPLSRRLFERMAERVCVSAEAERSIARYFPARFEIVPNGVDVERFSPTGAVAGWRDEERPSVLFVGRADPRKGLPLLVQAFAELRRRLPRARLVVAGVEAREGAPLVAGVPEATRAAISFEGYVAPAELPGHYRACDVFCSPATGRESQGVVLLEAMASGRPALAFAIPGYRDVVSHARDGWLVPEIAAAPLAEALATLLGKPELRAGLGRAGRETALRYAWPALAERIEAVLARAAATRRRARG